MRTATYAAKKFDVQVLSLKLGGGHAGMNGVRAVEEPQIALLSPVEIPIGDAFTLENGVGDPLRGRAMGCARNPNGRFLILGVIGD